MTGDSGRNNERYGVLQAQGERVDLEEEQVNRFKRLDVVVPKFHSLLQYQQLLEREKRLLEASAKRHN